MARLGSGQLRLRLAWARPATTPLLAAWPHGPREGAVDLGKVEEDAREERRGRWSSEGVRGQGATRAGVARRGGRRGVAVGRVEERVQEAARVLSYDQAAAAFFVWRKEKRS